MKRILIPFALSALLMAGCAAPNDPNAHLDPVSAGLIGGPLELASDIAAGPNIPACDNAPSDAEEQQVEREQLDCLLYSEIAKARVAARRDETLRLSEPSPAEYWTMPAWQYPLTY